MSDAALGIKKLYRARDFILGGSILTVGTAVLKLNETWEAILGLGVWRSC